MEDENIKFVEFDKYCSQCKHYDVLETEEPCNGCLTIAARANSHKPEKFEEKKK